MTNKQHDEREITRVTKRLAAIEKESTLDNRKNFFAALEFGCKNYHARQAWSGI